MQIGRAEHDLAAGRRELDRLEERQARCAAHRPAHGIEGVAEGDPVDLEAVLLPAPRRAGREGVAWPRRW